MGKLNVEQQALVRWLRDSGGWHHPNGIALAASKGHIPELAGATSGAVLSKLVRLEARGLVRRRVVDGRINMWQAAGL